MERLRGNPIEMKVDEGSQVRYGGETELGFAFRISRGKLRSISSTPSYDTQI